MTNYIIMRENGTKTTWINDRECYTETVWRKGNKTYNTKAEAVEDTVKTKDRR